MQPYVFEKTDKTVTVRFKDPDMTIITAILNALRNDSKVEIVRFIDVHPELLDKGIYVQLKKKGDALDVFKKAAKSVSDYYGKLKA